MPPSVLVTGSTDGIGLETAKRLASQGCHVHLHGRSPAKLDDAERAVREVGASGRVEGSVCDLSRLREVEALAVSLAEQHDGLDALVNNAGVLPPDADTEDGLDARFVVNAIAPYVLTRGLLAVLGPSGRVVNVSSAAQSAVDPEALAGRRRLSDNAAYAQSKLALTMWSRHLALERGDSGPAVVAVNPGSMLGTKMVTEGYGVAGRDIGTGADVLSRAAVGDEFASASGEYFDNDSGRFAPPHPDALDPRKTRALVEQIEAVLRELA